MAGTLRRIVEIGAPPASRAQVRLFTGSILRDAKLWSLTLDVFQPVCPSYGVTRFSSFACIRNLGRIVLFDFTFVHLFPAAAVASGNCELSEHSVPWLKSILRDPMIKSLAVQAGWHYRIKRCPLQICYTRNELVRLTLIFFNGLHDVHAITSAKDKRLGI